MAKTKAKAKAKTNANSNTNSKAKNKENSKHSKNKVSEMDRKMAKFCLNCTVCKYARKQQKGAAYWFVKKIEGSLCPFCRAYERVYGRKAHQPIF